MTDALREAFELYFADSRRGRGAGRAPTFARMADGTYADDPTQRHWWTWQNACRPALAAPAVPPEWQPIETAPAYPFVKERWYVDGPRYLLSTGSSVFIGQYGYTERGKGRWQDHYGRICQPTHWMPLPAAPTAQQEPTP